MNTTLLLVVLTLATFRLTRLVTRDDFPPIYWTRTRLQRARPAVYVQDDDAGHYRWWWLGELVSCPWCASAYVSGVLVAGTWLVVGLPVPVLSWLAVWAGGALVAHWVDD